MGRGKAPEEGVGQDFRVEVMFKLSSIAIQLEGARKLHMEETRAGGKMEIWRAQKKPGVPHGWRR